MGEIQFQDNYRDLSVEEGANAGFQFEFYCERCSATWRSDFVPFRTGQAAEWVGRAAGIFGGVLGGVANVADGASEAGYGVAHDRAFEEAIAAAQAHFHRCAKCTNYFCDKCWNAEAGLCFGCAPSAEVEIEAARAQGMVQGAGEKAVNEGILEGKHMDVKRRRQLVCPKCGAETDGAKFCPECGEKLAAQSFCTECGAEIPGGAKFCPECGAKAAAAGT